MFARRRRLFRPALVGALAATLAVGCGDGAERSQSFTAPAPSASPVATPQPTPMVTPVVTPIPAPTGYTFPLSCSDVRYSRTHHDYPATDMFAKVGCPFVSPVDGVVDEVATTDEWSPRNDTGASRGGLSVSVIGSDGVRYYGSHLSAVEAGIEPGAAVVAGQPLGEVGNSGSARSTPSHLHFGISWPTGPDVWWVRRGEIWPAPYLDAWREGRQKSPAAAVAKRHRAVGDRGCTGDC